MIDGGKGYNYYGASSGSAVPERLIRLAVLKYLLARLTEP